MLVRYGRIYFISTNGGNMGFGQVWVYDLGAQTLTLVVESPGHDVFDGPDNCCVTPRGGLIFCEDATGGAVPPWRLPPGEVFDLARNLRNTIEFAGVCFSPDGRRCSSICTDAARADYAAVPEPGADPRRPGEFRTRRHGRDLGAVEVGAAVKRRRDLTV